MTTPPAPVLRIERRKLLAAPVTRIATMASVMLATATTAGGYAAATRAPNSEMGRKANAMLTSHDWDGYVGLASLSTGITLMLCAGIVLAWAVGREFTDGTVTGLFAVAATRRSIARAKLAAWLTWGVALVVTQTTISALAGAALGLPPAGVIHSWLILGVSNCCLLGSLSPIAWVSTHGRGYLAGIGATLALLVTTNLTSGFGLGQYIPWAVPTLWAAPGTAVSTTALTIPLAVGALGIRAATTSWNRLQLGRD